MPTTTRRLQSRDRDRWDLLFQGYIEFYRAEVPADVRELTFARLLAGDDLVGFVAVDDDRPVGLAHLLFHRSTWSPNFYCYLEDLFVDPALRGSGVGRMLISAVRDEAAFRHATRLHWTTQTDNATARRLYDSVATVAPFVQYRIQL